MITIPQRDDADHRGGDIFYLGRHSDFFTVLLKIIKNYEYLFITDVGFFNASWTRRKL